MNILYFYAILLNLIKTEQTIEKNPNFQKIIMKIWASLRQNFKIVAWFLLELFRCLENPKNLWWCPLVKREQTIKKLPNFQEIFRSTRKSLKENLNTVAWFVLELFRCLRNPKNLWWCPRVKRERTIEKLPNFQEIFRSTRKSLSQNFNAVAWFVLELLKISLP